MALGDTVKSRIILEYKADVEDAKAKIRSLAGEQKKSAQQAVQGVEDQIKAHERLAAKVTLGIGIAAGAIALGIQGFKKYEEATRLGAASAGASMEGLRKASHGLLTDMQLMSVAAQGMNGRFKLTATEMEMVLGAAVALERKGLGPLDEISRKLTETIKKGEVEAFKELGIEYDANLAKTDKRAAALGALSKLSREAADGTRSETEAIRAHGVEFGNSMDKIQQAIGRLVISFEPLISAFADIAGTIGNIADEISRIPGLKTAGKVARTIANPFGMTWEAGKMVVSGFSDTSGAGAPSWWDEQGYERSRGPMNTADPSILSGALGPNFKPRTFKPAKSAKRRGAGGAGGGGSKGDDGGGMVDDAREWLKAATRDNARLWLLMESALGDEAGPSIDDLMKGKDAPSKAHTTKSGNYSGTDPQAAKAPTLLERMFGTPDDIAIYNNLVGGLMDAATSGFNALVTDSESAGTAIKRVIGQTVMAEGAHMLVLALKEGAYAIADLARGNFAGAAAHGASAAKFGAGAALAGVVARGLGANEKGGWGGRPEDPKPKDSNGGGAGGGPIDRDSAPRNTNIVLGHGWDDETPRQRSARFARAQRQAASYEAAPSHLEYR